MIKYIFLFVALTVFSFSSAIEISDFYPIDMSENLVQFHRETSLLQMDYSLDLEKQLRSQVHGNETLNDILAKNSDVLIVRHIPSLEISDMLASCLCPYYADIYQVVINEDISDEAESFDGVLIASKIAISSPEKVNFGSSTRKCFIEFTIFECDVAAAEFFILNDEAAVFDDSLKLEQLNKISEQAELIAVNGYQIPCVLCVKSCCLPKHNSGQQKNQAIGQFIGEKDAILECMKEDSRQNFALVLTNTTSFQGYNLNFGYEIASRIEALADDKSHICLSSIKWIEKPIVLGSNFTKATKSNLASMKLQAKDEREAKVSVEKDSEGNAKVEGSVSISRENDNGSRFEISGSGSIERNSDGSTSGSAKAEASVSW